MELSGEQAAKRKCSLRREPEEKRCQGCWGQTCPEAVRLCCSSERQGWWEAALPVFCMAVVLEVAQAWGREQGGQDPAQVPKDGKEPPLVPARVTGQSVARVALCQDSVPGRTLPSSSSTWRCQHACCPLVSVVGPEKPPGEQAGKAVVLFSCSFIRTCHWSCALSYGRSPAFLSSCSLLTRSAQWSSAAASVIAAV